MALQNIEANITLDLYNHDTTPTTIKAIQLDSETRYVAARLQNMGAQYDVDSGATIQLTVIRPDKVGVQITGTTFTYGDEGAQYLGPYAELTLVALAVSGKLLGQFKITSGTQILRTEIFTISAGVALDASTDEWAGEYDGYNLDELVQTVNDSNAKVDAMEDDVSELKSGFSELPKVVTPEESEADLYICDAQGNVIGEFSGGHIKTKNFDSSTIDTEASVKIKASEEPADLDITDEKGNVIARFANGHFQTKSFNSATVPTDKEGLLYVGIPQNGTILFTSEDVTEGDVLSIVFTAYRSSYGCYIDVLDANSRRITYIGRAGSGTETEYSVDFTIPANFEKAVASCIDTTMLIHGIAIKDSYVALNSKIIHNAKIDHPKIIDLLYSTGNRLANPLYETYEHYNAEHTDNPIEALNVIHPGVTGNAGYRIPTAVITNNGTFLVAAEHRTNALGDYGDFSVDVARKTVSSEWTLAEVIPFDSTRQDYGSCLNPEFLVDRNTGRIYLFYGTEKQAVVWWDVATEDGDLRYTYSDDDGETWSAPVSLKTLWDTSAYEYCIPSCTKGITLTNGTLVVPCFCKKVVNNTRLSYSLLLIKPIDGEWYFSSVASLDGVKNLDECSIVEGIADNEIWLYCRQNGNYPSGIARGYHKFVYSISKDTFNPIESTFDVNRSNCMCVDRITIDGTLIYLLTLTDTNDSTRKNITLWASLDGDVWIRVYRMYKPAGVGYSVVDNHDGKIAVAYEANNGIAFQNVSALSNLIYDSSVNYIVSNISIQDRMQMLFNAANGID